MSRTWLADESLAYNTYAGGHSRSNRRGAAIYPDGQVRKVTAGVADTYFTVPAHGYVRGRYVSGFLTVEEDEYHFTVLHPKNFCWHGYWHGVCHPDHEVRAQFIREFA